MDDWQWFVIVFSEIVCGGPSNVDGRDTAGNGLNNNRDGGMTRRTIVVGFDGTDSAKRALDYAIAIAKLQQSPVHVVHVLEWSPYSFLTVDEVAERHKRRLQEVKRAESVIAPAMQALRDAGVTASSEVRYGHVAELMCEIAEQQEAAQLIVGRTGGGGLAQRILGSLALALAQASPVPVTVVP